MKSDQRLLDDRNAVWFPYLEKASTEITKFLPLFVPILGGLFALMIALFMPTDPGSLSRWWALAFGLIPTALYLFPVWLVGVSNFRSTSLGVTPEGFIYRVPGTFVAHEAHIHCSEIISFARTFPDNETLLQSYSLDTQDVLPIRDNWPRPEAQVILANSWLYQPVRSPFIRLFVQPRITRKKGVWFRPEAFERNWWHGEIGRRLAQSRRDLFIPLEGSPLPRAYDPRPREWD